MFAPVTTVPLVAISPACHAPPPAWKQHQWKPPPPPGRPFVIGPGSAATSAAGDVNAAAAAAVSSCSGRSQLEPSTAAQMIRKNEGTMTRRVMGELLRGFGRGPGLLPPAGGGPRPRARGPTSDGPHGREARRPPPA